MVTPAILECAGVYVDFAAHTIHALGRPLPVTAVAYSEASPERPGSDRVATPAGRQTVEFIYKTPERIAAAILRPIQAMPESLHFNILCENGWWIEAVLWPEDDGLSFGLPPESFDPNEEGTAIELLALLDEVSYRPMYVPSTHPDDYDEPWGGLAPGSWELAGV